MILSLPFSSSANALSATTASTIQGTEPLLKQGSENRLGFTLGGKFYSESSMDTSTTGNIVSGTSKTFDKKLTFNDFAVKTLTSGDFTVANDYDDSDGDIAKTSGTGAFTVGGTTYKWTDNAGTVIPQADYGKMIGCGSGYSMPLTLEITLSNVQVHSEYGDPKDSTLTNVTKTYQIASTTGLCYVRPNAMKVTPTQTWMGWNGSLWDWNQGGPVADSITGGGYSSDFDPVWGFNPSASPAFPTTGFPSAQFQLVMTGAQTDWTYIVPTNPGNGVTVDSNGNVKLNSKPSGSVMVSATLKSDSSVQYDYSFNPTNIWVTPFLYSSTYSDALDVCGGEANIPRRADLTNSPRKNQPEGIDWTYTYNFYTRAIGDGVFSEWGLTDNTTYPSSGWGGDMYWVQEKHILNRHYLIHSHDGTVDYQILGPNYYVVCLE